MKIIKKASGKLALAMSREEWEMLGQQNGWMDQSGSDMGGMERNMDAHPDLGPEIDGPVGPEMGDDMSEFADDQMPGDDGLDSAMDELTGGLSGGMGGNALQTDPMGKKQVHSVYGDEDEANPNELGNVLENGVGAHNADKPLEMGAYASAGRKFRKLGT